MTRFDLTRAARADLKSIARFTQERWGLHRRNAYLKQMDRAFRALADNPGIGQACDDIRTGYCKFPQGAHVIFYKEMADHDLLIVRILHAAMDVDTNIGA